MTATLLNLILADRPAWHASALCAQTDPDIWFPEKGGQVHRAKSVCAACPVRRPCLDAALTNRERHGVWGGLSEKERRQLVRDRGQGQVAA